MYGYVYITINLLNDKKYIGQHKSEKFDNKYVGSGLTLWKAIDKYGIENFKTVMVHEAYTKKELNELEKYYILFFNACRSKNFYNVSQGGEGGNTRAGYTEEQQLEYNNKLKLSLLENRHKLVGKIISDEVRKKISGSLKGRKMSEEHKRRIVSEESRKKLVKVTKVLFLGIKVKESKNIKM